MRTVLRIGQFSQLAGVTIRALRHYDHAGVFRPAYIAPESGYRYYRADQLAVLEQLRMLQELGCSLREAREIAALAPDSREHAVALSGLRRRLMVRVVRAEQSLRQLDAVRRPDLAERGRTGRPSVSERPVGPVCALTMRKRVRSLGAPVEQMFEAAEREVARQGVRARASPFLLFHDFDYRQTNVEVEVCVPVTAAGVRAGVGRRVDALPRAACLRFTGGYDQAPSLFESALQWMQTAGVRIAGPVREVYLRFGANQDGYMLSPQMLASTTADYDTELQIPITAT